MSTVGGKLRLLSPWPVLNADAGSAKKKLNADASGLVEMDTKVGETFVFIGN